MVSARLSRGMWEPKQVGDVQGCPASVGGDSAQTKAMSRCPYPRSPSLPSDFPGVPPVFAPGESWRRGGLKQSPSGRELVIKNAFSLGVCFENFRPEDRYRNVLAFNN